MSGRAGRRGIDDRGLVILMIDEKMSPGVCKDMVRGQANKLDSAFHLTYNMVLNLLRVEEINPEFMLERSFFQVCSEVRCSLNLSNTVNLTDYVFHLTFLCSLSHVTSVCVVSSVLKQADNLPLPLIPSQFMSEV